MVNCSSVAKSMSSFPHTQNNQGFKSEASEPLPTSNQDLQKVASLVVDCFLATNKTAKG